MSAATAINAHRPTLAHSEADTSTLCGSCGLPWPCDEGQAHLDFLRTEIERLDSGGSGERP